MIDWPLVVLLGYWRFAVRFGLGFGALPEADLVALASPAGMVLTEDVLRLARVHRFAPFVYVERSVRWRAWADSFQTQSHSSSPRALLSGLTITLINPYSFAGLLRASPHGRDLGQPCRVRARRLERSGPGDGAVLPFSLESASHSHVSSSHAWGAESFGGGVRNLWRSGPVVRQRSGVELVGGPWWHSWLTPKVLARAGLLISLMVILEHFARWGAHVLA